MDRKDLFKPYEGEEGYIFVSYSHSDSEKVYDIITALYNRGYRIWHDNGIPPGGLFVDLLVKKVEECEAFFCFLSPAYVESDSCMRELRLALIRKKKIVPVELEEIELPPELSFSLGPLNWVCPSSFGSVDEFAHEMSERTAGFLDSCQQKNADVPAAPTCAGGGGGGALLQDRPRDKDTKKPPKQGFFSSLFSRRNKSGADQNEAISAPKPNDTVSFSVLSPRAVIRDSVSVINIYMYTGEQREVVERAIRESEGLVRETSKNGFSVARQTHVTVRLESEDAEIKDPLETQVWNGESLHFDFQFRVRESCLNSQIAFTCYVEFNGIPVTRLNFIIAVSSRANPKAIPAKVIREDYHKAFISYSRADEQRMLERVLGIQELVPEMKFWLDKQSLDAGDLWREEIRKAIDLSDIFLLFWSVAASHSEYVEKEWRYGLEAHGLPFIAPVPLDPPQQCPPPEPLESLNFTVRAFSQNEITEKLSFFNSKNIEVL